MSKDVVWVFSLLESPSYIQRRIRLTTVILVRFVDGTATRADFDCCNLAGQALVVVMLMISRTSVADIDRRESKNED